MFLCWRRRLCFGAWGWGTVESECFFIGGERGVRVNVVYGWGGVCGCWWQSGDGECGAVGGVGGEYCWCGGVNVSLLFIAGGRGGGECFLLCVLVVWGVGCFYCLVLFYGGWWAVLGFWWSVFEGGGDFDDWRVKCGFFCRDFRNGRVESGGF